jgi:hypothetical protein
MVAPIRIEGGITIEGGTTIGNVPVPPAPVLMLNLDAATYAGSGPWIDTVGAKSFTLYGSPTYNAGDAGGTFSFDAGYGQYAESNTSLSNLSTWSVVVWHYYNNTNTGSSPCIITEIYPGSTGQINYALGSLNDNSPGLMAGWYSGAWGMTPYTLTSGNWYQLVGTYDGTTVSLYVNNTLIRQLASVGGPPISSQGGIRLMRRWDNPEYWGGKLGIVQVYENAMRPGDIAGNWISNRARFGL